MRPEEMPWVRPHYQAPLTLLPLFSPLHVGDRAQVPFPPQEASTRPTLTNFSEGAKQPTQRDTRIQPRA